MLPAFIKFMKILLKNVAFFIFKCLNSYRGKILSVKFVLEVVPIVFAWRGF